VTICSPFLEVLNLTQPGPPVGDLANLELSPLLFSFVQEQLNAISAIENEDDVDFSKGILVGGVEYSEGDELLSLGGVHFTLLGNNIEGARTMYMDTDRTWNRKLDRTTTAGTFVIYNIPLYREGWNDVGLSYEGADGFLLGVYPWIRVYAFYSENGYTITDAHYEAVKLATPENDDGPGLDDGGGGSGGGGCFIATAMN